MGKLFTLARASKDTDGQDYQYELPQTAADCVEEADKVWRRSFSLMYQYFVPLFDFSWKKYMLCEADRLRQFTDPTDSSWRANISSGVIREAVDTAASYLKSSLPIQFVAEGADEAGMKNAPIIGKALTYAGDETGLHNTMRHAVTTGMIEGVIVLKACWVEEGASYSVTVMEDGIPTVQQVRDDPYSGPGCYTVDPYAVFPDFYPRRPGPRGRKAIRYVTERGVCSLREAKRMFGALIASADNECPIAKAKVLVNGKDADAIDMIQWNDGGVSKEEYGWEKHEVIRTLADKIRQEDGFSGSALQSFDQQSRNFPIIGNFGRDPDLAENLVEWRVTTWEDRICLLFNGFPVAVAKNKLGFVPYVFVTYCETDLPISMGLPIVLRDLDMQATSFLSGYSDNVKSAMNKALIVQRNQILQPGGFPEKRKPGEVIYADGDIDNVSRPLDTGTPQDYGILKMVSDLAQRRTGMSDYNVGASARERTAMGATELTESLLRRMGPYLANVAEGLSEMARMWLTLMRRYWPESKWAYFRDDDDQRVGMTIQKDELMGGVGVSVEIDGMVANNNSVKVKRIVDFCNTFGELADVSQAAKIAAKLSGLPSKIVVVQGQVGFKQPVRGGAQGTPPAPAADGAPDLSALLSGNPTGDKGEVGQQMQDAMSTQPSYQ